MKAKARKRAQDTAEPNAVAQRERSDGPGTAADDMANSQRSTAQRHQLMAAFGNAVQVKSPGPATGAGQGVAQLVSLYGEALLTGAYHGTPVGERPAEFVKVRRAVRGAIRILEGMKTRLGSSLQEMELAPLAGNPISLKLAELQLLVQTLNQSPTPTRWATVQAAEAALAGQDSATLATASFDFEKARMKAQLRKMRVDTFGTREYILTQLGDERWMNPAQVTAVATLRTLKAQVDTMMAGLDTGEDFPDWDSIPGRLVDFEQQARDAADGPFAQALAAGWQDNGAEAPTPRAAALYFHEHILARHAQSSTAPGAGKFNSDDWGTIRGRINAALTNGALTGPHFNVAADKPRGRFELTHDSGAPMGTTIGGAPTRRIFVVVTRSGKSVVTAYPV